MIRHVMAMIIGIGLTSLAHAATNIVEYAGTTQEENRQLSGLVAAGKAGELTVLKYLDRVVGEYPTNGPARLYRASALMNMGRMDEALKDLGELARSNPECFGLSDVQTYFYRIKGDRAKELDELKAVASKEFTLNVTKPDAQLQIRWRTKSDAEAFLRLNRARIAELSDDIALAKKEWQTWVDEAPPQQRADRMTDQVQFYLRQGDYAKAVALAKAAVELHRRQSHEGYSLANTLTWYGFSLWADGKRAEALAAFLDAAEQPIEEFYANSRTFDPAHRSLAIFGARALAASGTDKDKARAAKLMSDLGKSASGKMPYSLEPVVLALTGKSEMKPAVDTVTAVLKQAPNLDWALWAALYLGLSGRDEGKPLLTLLPNGTIQRRIAEQEGKVPTIHPTNLGRE